MDKTHEALAGDSEAFFLRNRDTLVPKSDRVMGTLELVNNVSPIHRLLEVGCSNGWRLSQAAERFGCAVVGIEAGESAVEDGRRRFPEVEFHQGLAPAVIETALSKESFDCIVLGFFMYLLPREDLFRLAASIDALLSDDGHLVVQDFLHPSPIQAVYAHDSELRTYKLDPSSPWSWSPTYTLVHRDVYNVDQPAKAFDPSKWVVVDALRKGSVDHAYPRSATMPSAHAGP